MSVEIEYCDTCTTKEQICAKAQQIKEWFLKAIEEEWAPMSYNDPHVKAFDQPNKDGKIMIMTKTSFNCDAKKVYDYLTSSDYKQQHAYDSDLLAFERDQVFKEEGCEVSRTLYKATWPVSPREFISVQCWEQMEDRFVCVQESVNYPLKWNSVNKDWVRGYKKSGIVMIPDGPNKCEVRRIVIIDARGSVPTWIVGVTKTDEAKRVAFMKKFCDKTFGQ